MLNQHPHAGMEPKCRQCGKLWFNSVHYPPFEGGEYDQDSATEDKPNRSGFWGGLAFFVLISVAAAATVYNLWMSRWDRATYFLVVTHELLRLWGKYESKRQ